MRVALLLASVANLISAVGCTSVHPKSFEACVENNSNVSAACVYTNKYPACQITDIQDALAIRKVAAYLESTLTADDKPYFTVGSVTGKSQDLGSECRYYVVPSTAEVDRKSLLHGELMIYLDKSSMEITRIARVIW